MLQKLKNEIIDFIKNHPCTSFVELERFISGFLGELGLFLGEDDYNILLWTVSVEAAVAFKELLQKEVINLSSCSPLIYMIDGKGLNLPYAKRRVHYKEPHWLPITMSTIRYHSKRSKYE
jgi:hypothetical protein